MVFGMDSNRQHWLFSDVLLFGDASFGCVNSSASRERRNVTAANGFLRFPDNRKISALASMARVVRAGPAQGWALEMQGIPMVFKGGQLIPVGAKVACI